ncbi:hypothetical protein MAPG_11661 [Magnaporthiopsis poae ATCC 64411]|uniref:Uncharacterized protein n=1 Tax=Magnaporthiopsis poae (strain ATCC 64411 / 73-15) TaxID=644358 RepID=A0A0C4EFV3_MAGP6|nr:hypothetical protein MAPG_11661 [Magnaporthiopsis poae ATCC 64411]
MSEWIEEWIENRGRRESGGRVPNFEALSEVNDLVDEVEYGSARGDGGGGLEISFWHAPRDGFFSADWLVEYGFDEVEGGLA